jgi:hypothetical protein
LIASPDSEVPEIPNDFQEALLGVIQHVFNEGEVPIASELSGLSKVDIAEYQDAVSMQPDGPHWLDNGNEEEIDSHLEEIIPLDNPRKLQYRHVFVDTRRDE